MDIFRISPLLFFFIGISPFVCIQFALIILQKNRSKAVSIKRCAFRWIFIIYILTLFSLSLFPVQYDPSVSIPYSFPQINLIQFQSMFNYSFLKFTIADLLVLIPLGYLLPLLNSHFHKFYLCFATALVVSLVIKILQYIEIYYCLNLNHKIDSGCVLLNLIGACFGHSIWRHLHKFKSTGR